MQISYILDYSNYKSTARWIELLVFFRSARTTKVCGLDHRLDGSKQKMCFWGFAICIFPIQLAVCYCCVGDKRWVGAFLPTQRVKQITKHEKRLNGETDIVSTLRRAA